MFCAEFLASMHDRMPKLTKKIRLLGTSCTRRSWQGRCYSTQRKISQRITRCWRELSRNAWYVYTAVHCMRTDFFKHAESCLYCSQPIQLNLSMHLVKAFDKVHVASRISSSLACVSTRFTKPSQCFSRKENLISSSICTKS